MLFTAVIFNLLFSLSGSEELIHKFIISGENPRNNELIFGSHDDELWCLRKG
jgi:hypothetical protein